MMKNINMRIADFFEEAGMKKCKTFHGALIFYTPGDDRSEYVRFFSPQIISKKKEKKLVGVLGSIRKDILDHLKDVQRPSDYFLLTVFSANFPNLRNPPAMTGDPEIESEWCNRIVHVLKSFPISHEELENITKQGASIHGFTINRLLIAKEGQ